LVSSESFTWLDEHWTVTTSDMMRATNRFLLAGINHMFFHGTSYSPADAEWPGWLFYASSQINNRNPLWRELPTLFKYIERSQSVMQNSTPENDLLVYWPYYDVAASEGPIFNHLGVNKDAGWFISHPIHGLSESLMDAGYTFDYISDKQLLNCQMLNGEIVTGGDAKYKAVVVPKTKYIPVETLEKLAIFISEGGKIYFDEILPESVPGIFDLEERTTSLTEIKFGIANENVTGNVLELLADNEIEGEKSITENGLNFIKMKMDEELYYMVFNCGLNEVDTWVNFNESVNNYVFMNPYNGEITLAENEGNSVRIQLVPERSVFIRCAGRKPDVPKHVYRSNENVEIEGLWKINFVDGGPVYPGNISTDELKSWTKMGDNETSRFAGTAKYTTEFHWNESAKTAFLNLGEVKDCAHVYLNGKDFGSLLGPVYNVKVDNLQQGKNELVVEVTNVAANRIRDLDRRGVNWKKFHDINFVNIDYEPFDASDWEIREAGLLGPVTLSPVELK
ncbi:MAG TPA: glycosyl hydrolase, partial [Tangfeifania sp.]|nr:glycosyl hydrolase [Tangfeifania sp.]